MAGKKGKGNNTAGRVKTSSYRRINGEEVKPTLYVGKYAGHGTYMAGKIGDKLVLDATGRPVPYKQITEGTTLKYS